MHHFNRYETDIDFETRKRDRSLKTMGIMLLVGAILLLSCMAAMVWIFCEAAGAMR